MIGQRVTVVVVVELAAVCVAFLATHAEAGPIVQPTSLGTIGVRQLQEEYPAIDGSRVRIGLVELCEPTDETNGGYAFLPDFGHRSLSSVSQHGVFCYENPHRPARCSAHATIIAALLWGRDNNGWCSTVGDFSYHGIVPGASAGFYETNRFINQYIFRRFSSGESAERLSEDVLSISWGTDANDVVTMFWQRGIDALVEQDSCVIVAGCGNGHDEFGSITKPSWGYNVISVGCGRPVGGFPERLWTAGKAMAEYSNCGPTDDGRCKPDVISPGLVLGPVVDSTESYSVAGATRGYSSFACPHVAGIAALLIDAARYYNLADGDDPRVIKALILNGANKLTGWTKGNCLDDDDVYKMPLDCRQGAGLVDAGNSFKQLMAGRCGRGESVESSGWTLATIGLDINDPNSRHVYALSEPTEVNQEIKATLTWYRHYASGGMFVGQALNVLTLELWSVDEEGELVTMLDNSTSRVDNVQHIFYRCIAGGRVAFVVSSGDAESQPGNETYGLAYTTEQLNWPGDQMAGDLNADGIVNVGDLMQWAAVWISQNSRVFHANPEGYGASQADANGDGVVNSLDFDVISNQWLERNAWYRQ